MFSRFLYSSHGNMALMFALLLPMLMGCGALAIDYTMIANQTSRLQQVADAAALAGARELGIAGNDDGEVREVTQTYALSNYYLDRTEESERESLEIKTTISGDRRNITVDLEYYWSPFFAHFIASDVLPLQVTAKAGLAGGSSICTLTLDGSVGGSLSILGNSRLQARECSVHTNSKSVSGMLVDASAKLITGSACTSGGFAGAAYSYSPVPVTDCSQLDDPLAQRVLPSEKGGCTYNHKVVFRTKKTLSPGKYCGGLVLLNHADVTLQPGNYVFVDGDLDMGEAARLTGDGVNLHFAKNSRLIIRNNSLARLTAPRTGSMAGIVVSSGPGNDPDLLFEVESRDARQLTGLIYLPSHTLKLGDDLDGDGRCDVTNDEYRLNHPRGHTHEHIHEDGTIHTHGHFKTGTYPWNADGIKEHPSQTSHIHDDIVEENPDCLANIGEHSDWTAIIARNVMITNGVNLVLNADYENSPVPVPLNNGVVGTMVKLAK